MVCFLLTQVYFRNIIIHNICFNPINNFHAVFFPGRVGIRKRLHYTVICNCYGFMPQLRSELHQITNIIHTVHTAHLCMQVQFYTFFCCFIQSTRQCMKVNIITNHPNFVTVGVILHLTAHLNGTCAFQSRL